jgi:SAM-dependent methyltransferase
MPVRQRVPWFVKMPLKMGAARLPVHSGVWRRLGVFKHGDMVDAEYVLSVFERHFLGAGFEPDQGFTALELGPGNSLCSAVVACGFGAGKTWLVDVGPFADAGLDSYFRTADLVRDHGHDVPALAGASAVDDVMARTGGLYRTAGLRSLAEIPDASVDFIWSHAVLEHVRRRDFVPVMSELHRVMRPDGVASHRVDLGDHLSDGLNNLRFSEQLWESDLMANSGFYTNRIQCAAMLEVFAAAGFEVEVVRVDRWTELPTPKAKMADPYRALSEDDLLVQGFDVVLRKRSGA